MTRVCTNPPQHKMINNICTCRKQHHTLLSPDAAAVRAQLRTMDDELALVKTCILQLYTGRQLQAPMPAPPAPPMPAPPAAAAGHAFGTPGAAGPTTKLR